MQFCKKIFKEISMKKISSHLPLVKKFCTISISQEIQINDSAFVFCSFVCFKKIG